MRIRGPWIEETSPREHRINARSHARRRAQERLNITLTNEDIEVMTDLVKYGSSVWVKHNQHLLRYGHKVYLVCYDSKLSVISTILPENVAAGTAYGFLNYKQKRKLGLK